MIYACQAEFIVVGNGQPTAERGLTNIEKYPLFRGTLDPDITFIGFDLEEAEARGDPDPQKGKPGWFIVIQEQPTALWLDVAEQFADTTAAHDLEQYRGGILLPTRRLRQPVHIRSGQPAGPSANIPRCGIG
jgi:hypothetical protein